MATAVENKFNHGSAIGYVHQSCRCTECVSWYCHNKHRLAGMINCSVRAWTPSEDAVVLRDDITAGEIARLIHRSIDAIYIRRSRLTRLEAVADSAEELDIRWDLSEPITKAPPLTDEQLDRVRHLLATT